MSQPKCTEYSSAAGVQPNTYQTNRVSAWYRNGKVDDNMGSVTYCSQSGKVDKYGNVPYGGGK